MRGLFLVAGFTVWAATGLAATAGAQTAPIERGQKAYSAEKCAICHAIEGKGNAKGQLDGVGSKLTSDDIRQWIVAAPEMSAKSKAARKPAMKAYANLSKEDLDGLVAYLASLKK